MENKIVATYHRFWIQHPQVIHNGADCEHTKTAIFSAFKEEQKAKVGHVEIGNSQKEEFRFGKRKRRFEDWPWKRWESDSGSKGLTPGTGQSAPVGLGEKIQAKKEPSVSSPDCWRKN